MSNSNAKRLPLQLVLNPVSSDSDRYAIRALQSWFRQAKQDHSVKSELSAAVKSFHRDVYLSGLFLYLLNPRLARNLANQVKEDQISFDTLSFQLQSCGFDLEKNTASSGTGASFDEHQLQQLQAMMAQNNQVEVIAELTAQVNSLMHVLQEQHKHVLSSEKSSSLETKVEQLTGNSPEIQRNQIKQENTEIESVEADAIQVSADMAAHIKQVQKVKNKGIF